MPPVTIRKTTITEITCPHPDCRNTSSYVKYDCKTSGNEWGSMNFHYGQSENYESDDSEVNDTSNFRFTCPECEYEYENIGEVRRTTTLSIMLGGEVLQTMPFEDFRQEMLAEDNDTVGEISTAVQATDELGNIQGRKIGVKVRKGEQDLMNILINSHRCPKCKTWRKGLKETDNMEHICAHCGHEWTEKKIKSLTSVF